MTVSSSPPGLRGYAGGILAGLICAGLFGFALMHADSPLVMLAYLPPLPLFIVGLGAGRQAPRWPPLRPSGV